MPIAKRLTAEFLGTFWLVFGGCGAAIFAALFLTPDKVPIGIGFAGVALAFGLTVLTGVYAFGPISGGHFNPDKKQHGWDNPMGHHNGDLPKNVSVGEDHTGDATFELTAISLDPAAPNSIFANGGTSVVVHEKADDMKTDPTGNAGNRIACAVVKQ